MNHGMIAFLLLRSAHDEFRRRRVPDGGIVAGSSVPGGILLAQIPRGLVLVPVVRPGEDRPTLVPDYLLRIEKPDAQEAIQNLARVNRGGPDVNNLEAGQQRECFGPIGSGCTVAGAVRGRGSQPRYDRQS